MNEEVQEKFEQIVKTLDRFISEVNNDQTEYCWTYDYSTILNHFTLYERNKETGETDKIQIKCSCE